MRLSVSCPSSIPPSASPYRLADECGQEVLWANAFLDAQRIRQLSMRSLRTYAFDLLHFARWSLAAPPHPLVELNQSALQDYVRHQLDGPSPPCAQTINRRLIVVERLYRFHYGQEIPAGQSHFQRFYAQRSALGYGRPRRVVSRTLRLKQQHRLVQPLTAEQVSQFWSSFRTFRDLAIVGLMLLDGLRSCEILALQLSDFHPADTHLHVVGKGGRPRMLPLPHELVPALEKYLLLERPHTSSQSWFVCLKGPHRGLPLTAAGLRSLFRHHRVRSRVPLANPHRFRHTFGADMARAGISLPALQQLMGHRQIQTTMLYVQLAPQDVWREFARAAELRARRCPPLP
jgi:site-specific recombinase XerD